MDGQWNREYKYLYTIRVLIGLFQKGICVKRKHFRLLKRKYTIYVTRVGISVSADMNSPYWQNQLEHVH